MRIASYAQQAVRAASLDRPATTRLSRADTTGQAVQVRLSESAKTLARATGAREDIGKVDAGLAKLQKSLVQARDAASDTERQQAYAEFFQARDAVALALDNQARNLPSAPAEVRRAGALDASHLGVQPQGTVRSLTEALALDPATATAAQQTQALQVVEQARSQVLQRQALATRPVEALTRQVTVLENTVATLRGETTRSQQRQVEALQALQQVAALQNPQVTGLNLLA